MRTGTGQWSTSSVDADTVASDHPTPRPNRPTAIRAEDPSGALPTAATDASSTSAPAASTGVRPQASAAQPTSGDSAYMPTTCRLTTSPMTRISAPPWCMCSGVITITATMTAWASARATIAAPTTGCAATTSRTRPHHARSPPRRPGRAGSTPRTASAASRATTSGSGLSQTSTTSAATAIASPPSRNGPVRDGRPRVTATRVPHPLRVGPSTAPAVAAHTTTAMARARRSTGARSVAAKRVTLLAAVVAPSSTAATSSRGNDPDRAADHAQQRAQRADREARDQAGTASPAPHHLRQPPGGQGRPEDLPGLHQAGDVLRAADVLGEQRRRGDADRGAHGPGGLARDEHEEGTALDGRDAVLGPARPPEDAVREPA